MMSMILRDRLLRTEAAHFAATLTQLFASADELGARTTPRVFTLGRPEGDPEGRSRPARRSHLV